MEKNMKSLIVMTMAMVIFGSMFFAAGCNKQANRQGTDWYAAVPKVEHERRFPHGHKHIPGPNGENCVYNEKTQTYFCQFDWEE